MKKIHSYCLMLLLFMPFIINAQYSSNNISLIGHWYNPNQVAESSYGVKYNSVWGWVDPDDNKEYAILGSGSGTHFIDLSDPANPIEKDFVAGRKNKCIWREYKTYQNYLYAVSDDATPNSFQIIDMSYLPDSVHVVHDGTSIFERAHTLYIDGNKLYGGSVTPTSGYHSMAVYNLANPELPVLLRDLKQDYPAIDFVHDMFVRNDTVYASCGYEGLHIYKFNGSTFSLINSLTSYSDQGYNHSSCLTQNGKTLVFCDEVPDNLGVKLLDVTDLQNMSVLSTFKSTEGATAHNPYIYGTNHVIIAYYQDGLQIFDISNPVAPVKTGFFDTDTLKGSNNNFPGPAYHGCWGAYVDLPSKNILASDMQNGLYVLDASDALNVGVPQIKNLTSSITVYPNPTNTNISLGINSKYSDAISIEIVDITGRKIISKKENVLPGSSTITISTEFLASGVYILKAIGKEMGYSQKIVKK
ncbi:MAG: choice-of-anchor B family protein [Bacteroidota bacterium]